MTDIIIGTGGSIPTTANELGKLMLWVTNELIRIQPSQAYILNKDFGPQFAFERHVFPTPGYGTRAVCSLIFEHDPTIENQSLASWKKFKPVLIDGNSPLEATENITLGTGGQIPASVTKLRELAGWLGAVADAVAPNQFVKESELFGFKFLAQTRTGPIDGVGTVSHFRWSIPVEPSYASVAQPLFTQARIFSNVVVPYHLAA